MPKQKAAARAVSRKATKGGILPQPIITTSSAISATTMNTIKDVAPGLAGTLPACRRKKSDSPVPWGSEYGAGESTPLAAGRKPSEGLLADRATGEVVAVGSGAPGDSAPRS